MMATYKVTAPDGNSYQINAPDDATPDQVQAYAQANYQHPDVQSGQTLTHASPDLPTVTVHPSAFQQVNQFGNDMGDAFVHNLAKIPVGIAQMGAHGIGSLSNAGASTATPGSLGDRVNQFVQQKVGDLDTAIHNNEQQYQAAVPTNVASSTGAVLGNVLPFVAGGEALQAPRVASTLGRIATGAATGGAIGATQPVTQTDSNAPSFAQQKAEQVGIGVLTGGALPAAGALGQKVIGTVAPSVQALAQKAADYGIDLTGPQVSKSIPLKIANKTTGQVPFSGATAFADKQQGQFNNAVAQTIGLPDGTTKITPDVFNQAKQAIGQGYNDLASRNNLTIDPPLVSRIQSILGEAHTDGDPDAARAISNLTTEIIGKASNNNSTLTGPQFQSLDSRLGRLASGQGDKAHYAGELQDALRQGMESGMSPADAARSQELRSQWRNALNLTPILADGSGDIPPSRLLSAVANNKAGKTQLAMGTRGDLGTLAQIGKQFLRDPAPDSGTAVRNVAFDTLKGLGAITAGATTGIGLPATAGTLVAARLIQSGLRSRALYNAISNLPAEQQGPVSTAVQALLSSQSAQNINRLNMQPSPSANNISQQVSP